MNYFSNCFPGHEPDTDQSIITKELSTTRKTSMAKTRHILGFGLSRALLVCLGILVLFPRSASPDLYRWSGALFETITEPRVVASCASFWLP
jgi:hypothetical protein